VTGELTGTAWKGFLFFSRWLLHPNHLGAARRRMGIVRGVFC